MTVGASGSVWMTPSEVWSIRQTVASGFDKLAIIQRFTGSGESEYGNETGGWVDSEEPVPCALVHMAGREVTKNRETLIADWFARFRVDTDINGNDRIVVDGITWEVVGPPADIFTHLRVQLIHISG